MARLPSLPPRLASLPARLTPAPATAATGFARSDGLSSTARGYGWDWRRFRAEILRREPLCRRCDAIGRVTIATELHHKQRFAGINDPLRLDENNVEPLCGPCHTRASQRQASGQG